MSEEKRNESGESAGQKWTDEVQGALDRTGDAVRTAWEATRESRMSALESAKAAVKELGEVLEKGVEAAKERWAASEGGSESSDTPPSQPTEPTAPPEPLTPDVEPTPPADQTPPTPPTP